jgi:hypothetical protein
LSVKRDFKLIAAAIIIMLASFSIILIQFFMLPPSPIKVIHVNPNTESSRLPLPKLLTLLVLNPFTAILKGNFSGVQMELNVLESAYIPSGLKFIVDRFKRLMNDVATHLDRADNLMDGAEVLIEAGRGLEAEPMLAEASGEIALANMTFRELRSASEELAGAFSLPRSDIYMKLNDLGRLIGEMHLRLLWLLDKIERQKTLTETFISINVEPKTVWTGGKIFVEGRLSEAYGKPLPGRRIIIFVGGLKMSEASTLLDGSFRAEVKLPYIYNHTVPVQAKYTPTGGDAEAYKPSTSDAVEVSLLYIEPKITVETVRRILPGRAFTVRGRVQSESPPPYRSVKVSWVNMVSNVELREDGFFEIELNTPGDISDGKYALRVNAPPSGVFAPAEATITLTVERIPVNVTFNPPKIAVAGLSIHLSGSYRAGGERFNATVKVFFAGQEYTVDSNGEFEVWLNPPLTLLSGCETITVRVTPRESWFSEAVLEASIPVVNPLTLLASIVFLAALLVKAFGGKAEPAAKVSAEVNRGVTVKASEVQFAPEEFRWLIDLYWEAVKFVGGVTGVFMEPYMTMREYLSAVEPKLGKLYWCLEALTSAAERALYSPSVPAWVISAAKMAMNSLREEHVKP